MELSETSAENLIIAHKGTFTDKFSMQGLSKHLFL